jgi:tocopherol O-methyltransferase
VGAREAITTQDVKRHYERWSLPFRVFWGEHLHQGLFLTGDESPRKAQIQLLEYCFGLVTIHPGSQVLDVGCGYGGTAIHLAQQFDCEVEGLTISPKQGRIAVNRARRAGVGDRVAVRVCDAERVDFDDEYDLIWMMESSEHLHDKRGCIEKAARGLRPGGRLLIAAWAGSMSEPRVREIAARAVCPGFQTAEDYEAQMRGAGLRIAMVRDLSEGIMPTWEICQRRVGLAGPLVRFMPFRVRDYIGAVPLLIAALGDKLMSYKIVVGEKPTGEVHK